MRCLFVCLRVLKCVVFACSCVWRLRVCVFALLIDWWVACLPACLPACMHVRLLDWLLDRLLVWLFAACAPPCARVQVVVRPLVCVFVWFGVSCSVLAFSKHVCVLI